MKKFHQFRRPARPAAAKTSWEGVSDWYGGHLSEKDSLLKSVVYPNAQRLLAPKNTGSYLDIACGEGTFAKIIGQNGAKIVGFDAAPSLVEQAKRQAPKNSFFVADAKNFFGKLNGQKFDGATCLLAIQNIDKIEPVFRDAGRALNAGAPLVIVMNHPCFRIPRQSAWGWEETRQIQYRRVDHYMGALTIPILAHPGANRSIKTFSYHRPISDYINELGKNGFAVDALEEWTSNRVSDSGPKAKAENRARVEIPMFLALRAIKIK